MNLIRIDKISAHSLEAYFKPERVFLFIDLAGLGIRPSFYREPRTFNRGEGFGLQ